MPRKLTNTEYIAKCVEKHGQKYDYSEVVYSGNANKVTIICKTHGRFEQRANDHLSKGAGCPSCSGVKPYTLETFVTKANIVHNSKYAYRSVSYKNVDTKVSITCSEHGEFLQTPHDHLSGVGCPKCAGLNRRTTQEFIDEVTLIHGDTYDYSEVAYVNSTTPVRILCKTHGEFLQKPVNHKQGKGCPTCGGVATETTAEFVKRLVARLGDAYNYSKVSYVNKFTNIEIVCEQHGSFYQLPYNHYAGSGCPKCASTDVSRPEQVLADALVEFKPTKNRTLLNGKELDLYFENHNLAVEVNGIYWHSEKFIGSEYHFDKTDKCDKLGIKLMQFTDSQINNKLPIVLSMIKNSLGCSTRVYARKLSVITLSSHEASKFFTDNHISGYASASVCYGLRSGSEILCAMSFSKPRFDTTHEWEIVRLASKLNTVVVGGASRLLKHFISTNNPSSIMSYSDLRYGYGNVYSSLGFDYIRTTEVGYSYHHPNGTELSRYKAQKHKQHKLLGNKFNPTKSSQDNMQSAGYLKVFDCGHKVFGMVLTKP